MLSRLSEFKKNSWVGLSGLVLADDFEKQISKFYLRGAQDRPLLIDFSKSEYIEIAALVNCIATLLQRIEHEYPTYLAWPASPKVRDFLRVWRFPEAVENATGRNIGDFLVTDQDLGVLAERQTTFTGQGDAVKKLEYDPDWEPQKKTRRNFFEFVTFKESPGQRIQPSGRLASAPREQGKQWTQPLIHEVLEKYLPGETTKDEIARVIVYEAMSNAIRHPYARVIQVVSRFGRKEDFALVPSGTLRICVWDDGESIANTLLGTLNEGRSVHAFTLPPYMCDRVHVTIRNFEQTKRRERVIDQSERITKTTTEARILLASLFPGVTRAAEKEVAKVEPFDERQEVAISPLLSSAPGMGLYALTRTVIDQFAGSLFIRSGRYRLIMKSAHDAYQKTHGVRYRCKVTEYPKHVPPFRGNLLAIQLPCRSK